MDALEQLIKGRTAIVIAHRLSTVRRADRIVVLEEGRVVEEGTHEHLIRESRIYGALWRQFAGEQAQQSEPLGVLEVSTDRPKHSRSAIR
jgi:ATP-binding cassette subfamily B protein